MIVLDTNVVSELMRRSPSAEVAAWLRRQASGTVTTTAMTVAEIRFGLARLPAGRRAGELQRAAGEVLDAFPHQVLPFDGAAAGHYGDLAAARERAGQPIGALDAQIAAICRAYGASLATRNTRNFLETGVTIVDPWTT